MEQIKINSIYKINNRFCKIDKIHHKYIYYYFLNSPKLQIIPRMIFELKAKLFYNN